MNILNSKLIFVLTAKKPLCYICASDVMFEGQETKNERDLISGNTFILVAEHRKKKQQSDF